MINPTLYFNQFATHTIFDDLDEQLSLIFDEPEVQQKVMQGNAEGYKCTCCKDFYAMAEINMPDKTFKCYSCREGLVTIFK